MNCIKKRTAERRYKKADGNAKHKIEQNGNCINAVHFISLPCTKILRHNHASST